MEPKREEYYLLLKGDTAGPFTLAELHQMWMDDKITLDTLFVRPGMRKCQPINLILGMVINYQEAQAVAAPARRDEDENPFAPLKNVLRWGLMGATAIMFLWVIGPWRKGIEDRSDVLRAMVEVKPADLKVVNGSDFEWKNMTVYINGQPPGGYRRKLDSLKPHAEKEITLLEFTDTAGAPFEPWRMEVTEVWIGNEELGHRAFRVRRPKQ